MRLDAILKWSQTNGKNYLMRFFYFTYIPIILFLGFNSMNLEALFPQLAKK